MLKKAKLTELENTKVTETEKKFTDHNQDKYIITLQFNKLAADFF